LCRVLLEKLTGLQLVKKFPAFPESEVSLPHSQASATCLYPGPPNPVHIPTSHLLEIHHNIILPSTPRSPQWSPSLRFPYQDPIHPPLLTIGNLIQSISSLSSSSSSFSSPSTYSGVFYMLILFAECYCCTWLHSMTHTLSRTSLDEGSAGRRDQFVFVAVLLKMWRHPTFRILVYFVKLQCYLSQIVSALWKTQCLQKTTCSS